MHTLSYLKKGVNQILFTPALILNSNLNTISNWDVDKYLHNMAIFDID